MSIEKKKENFLGVYVVKIGIISFFVFAFRLGSIFVTLALILSLLEVIFKFDVSILITIVLVLSFIVSFLKLDTLIAGVIAETGKVARYPQFFAALFVNFVFLIFFSVLLNAQSDIPVQENIWYVAGIIVIFEMIMLAIYRFETKGLEKVGESDVTRVLE